MFLGKLEDFDVFRHFGRLGVYRFAKVQKIGGHFRAPPRNTVNAPAKFSLVIVPVGTTKPPED